MYKIPKDIQSNKVFENEAEAIKVLTAEGKKLEKICRKVWRSYLDSYKPKVYAEHLTNRQGVRTMHSLDSISLGNVKKIGEDEFGIEVTFKNKLAYHESVFGNNQPKGHAIMLISSGWKVKKGKHKGVARFGYFDGFDYLGKVKEQYDAVRDKRISLDIQWLGNKNFTK